MNFPRNKVIYTPTKYETDQDLFWHGLGGALRSWYNSVTVETPYIDCTNILREYDPLEVVSKASMFLGGTGVYLAIVRIDGLIEYVYFSQGMNSLQKVHHLLERPHDIKGAGLLRSLGWIDPRDAFSEVREQLFINGQWEFFKLPDAGKHNTPMPELHYYQWLTKHKGAGYHSIETRRKYLIELGYNPYKHKLGKNDISLLKHVMTYHFSQNNVFTKTF